ncbi:MAG: C25 family cysteine peptidase [Candidatus Sumerlaeota bacterium]|nr:C25 family cysteine peptidase [Candidatus Sumerlaeota bacterium]
MKSFQRIAFMLSVFVFCQLAGMCAGQAPFPPGDLRVLTDRSTSGVLKLRLENLDRRATPNRQPRKQGFFIAGASGRAPVIRVTGASFYRVSAGQIVGHSNGIPESPENPASRVDPVQLSHVGRLRQYVVYNLAVSTIIPAQNPGGGGTYWMADYIEVDADLGPPPSLSPQQFSLAAEYSDPQAECASTAAASGPLLEKLADSVIINPNIDPSYFDVTPSRDWTAHGNWMRLFNDALSSGPVYKLTLYKPGLYRIGANDLQCTNKAEEASGADEDCGHPRRWQLYRNGSEVALHIAGASDGDSAMFVTDKFDADITGGQVYFLFTCARDGAGTAPQRLEILDDSTTDAPETTGPTLARFDITASELTDYNARTAPTAETTRWFWKSAAPGTPASLPLNLPDIFHPTAQKAPEVRIYYTLSQSSTVMPSLELVFNGVVGETIATGNNQGSILFRAPAGALKAGDNKIGVAVSYPQGTVTRPDVLIHKLAVSWTQPLGAFAETSIPFSLESPTTAPISIRFAGEPTTLPLYLVNVGGKQTPCAMKSISRPDGSCRAIFYDPHPGRGMYYAGLPERASVPDRIQRIAASRMRGEPVAGNYVVIAPAAYLPALRPLLEHRRAEGFAIACADPEAIFDCYSYGAHAAEGIKAFLSRALEKWPAPKPEYVLLAGEASDYRGDPRRLPPMSQIDVVPVAGDTRPEGFHGDHPYSTVMGSDCLSDLAVGRISVRSAAELTLAVRKILEYEARPAGEWQMRDMFVIDDNDEFAKVASDVIERGLGPYALTQLFAEADHPYVPNLRVAGRRRSHAATAELLRCFEQGRGLVNFFGHGGPNLWTHERLLHISDLPQMRNFERLPFITCSSCDNAWLDYPTLPVNTSMGELFVKQPLGGAIAVFAPVGGASPYEHVNQIIRLCEGIYMRGLRRAGMVAYYAMNHYYGDTASASLPDQYILLGDPALNLGIPRVEADLRVEPCVVPAGRSSKLRVMFDPSAPKGVSDGLVMIKMTGRRDEILTQPVSFAGPDAFVNLDVPPLAAGSYAVMLAGMSDGAWRVHAARLDADEPRLAFQDTVVSGPAIVKEGGSSQIGLRFFNPTRLDGARVSVSAALLGDRSDDPCEPSFPPYRQAINHSFSLDAGMEREFMLDWDSAWGDTLAVNMAVSGLNPPVDVPRAIYRLRRDTQTSDVVEAAGRQLRINPDPLCETDTPVVYADLWNIGAGTIKSAEAAIIHDGQAAAERIVLNDFLPETRRPLTFTLRKNFPAEPTSVTLEVYTVDRSSSTPVSYLIYQLSKSFTVMHGPDIDIVPGSVWADVPSSGGITRTSVFVHAQLRNLGDATAARIPVNLLIGDPVNGNEAVSLNDSTTNQVEEIKPGETRPIIVRWEDNTKPGEQRLWLAVNRQRSIRESRYDNNTAAVPPFQLRQLGNFLFTSFETSPTAARADGRLGLSMTVQNDGDEARGPLDVEFGLKNPMTGEIRSHRRIIPRIGPHSEASVTTELAMKPNLNYAYATVNASRELEELNTDDNTTQTPLLVVHSLTDLALLKDGTCSFRPLFDGCETCNMEFLPGGVLRSQDQFTSSSGLIPIDPSYYVSGRVTHESSNTTAASDNRWTLRPWQLEAAAAENAGEVRLRIPGGEETSGIEHEVKAVVLSGSNYNGRRVGQFEARVGQSGAFHLVDAPMSGSAPGEQCVSLGRQTLPGGVLDVTVRPTTGAAAIITAFELLPIEHSVVSPAIELPGEFAGRRAFFTVDTNSTSTALIAFARRYGAWNEHGGINWNEWLDMPAGSVASAGGQERLVQWKLRFAPQNREQIKTIIRDVRMKFE